TARQMSLTRIAELLEGYLPDGSIVRPEDRPIARALRGEAVFNQEIEMRRRDTGERLFIGSFNSAPVRDAAGQIQPIVVTIHDITRYRQMEDELREADRRKDQFLATLAHELRNPLAPIRNGLQILKLAAGTEPLVQRTTQIMERQMSHLVRLVDE